MVLAHAAVKTSPRRNKSATQPPDFWDPLSYQHEQASADCVRRVKNDIAEIEDYRPPGLFVAPEEHDLTNVHALVLGPVGTPYEGGFFHFLIKCPSDYPNSPPRARLMTTDSGRVRFGPNLYENGKVCLGLLGTWYGPQWSSAHCIGSLLMSFKSLLTSDPIAKGSSFGVLPAAGTWLSDKICYNDVLQHETIRVAVCDAVDACLQGTALCPQPLRQEILKHFPQFYDQYERVVKHRLHLTGSIMNDGSVGGIATYQYELLFQRLLDLREKVKITNEAAAKENNKHFTGLW
ncbi:hypothetical protein V5799_033116 [Amblyomma americanum]|uniref:Ubiquitin-conjugating enzyme E2 Z n=1 Tax=Amblyomma americanum TaxID=6943 RepID=A0AAQ4DP88_AMBAM